MPATSTGSRSVASTESNASSQGSLNSGEDDLGTPHQPHPAPVARDPAREAELLSSHLADGVAFGRLSGQYKDLLERALKSEESDGKAVEEHEAVCAQVEQIRRKNKELDGTISGSRASQAAATQKLQSLRSKISSTRSRQEQLANEANKYRASIVSAQNKVAETNAATNALHAERGALRNAAELASLDAEASELESKVASAVTGQQIRLSRISDLEAELEQIRAENSRLEAEHVAMVAAMRSYLDAAGS